MPPSGCGWGAFEQRYFFGDFGNGRVWTIDLQPDRGGALPGSRRDFAEVRSNVSFRMGPDAAMYVVSIGDGSIIRVAPRSVPASCGADAPMVGLPDAGADSGGCGCGLVRSRTSPLAIAVVALVLLAAAARVRWASRRTQPCTSAIGPSARRSSGEAKPPH